MKFKWLPAHKRTVNLTLPFQCAKSIQRILYLVFQNVLKADNFRSVFLSTYISAIRRMCPPQRHSVLLSGSPNATWELLRDTRRGLACLIQYSGVRYLVFVKDSCLSCLTVLSSISCDAVCAECSYWACSHQCKLLQYWIAALMLKNHLRLLWWSS